MFEDEFSEFPEEQAGLSVLQAQEIGGLLHREFDAKILKDQVAEIGRYYAHRIESAAQYCDAMAFFRVPDSLIERMANLFEGGFREGGSFYSLQEQMGISNDSLFAVYLHVQDLFDQEENTAKVENLLLLLIYLNPLVPSFWHALGVFYQKKHHWKEAANFYYFSLALSQDYTLSFFPLLGCLEQMQMYQEVKQLLEEFLEKEKKNKELQEWIKKGKKLLKAI
jgi:tetratricopeptide (TPR) repeat protein